MSTAYLVPLRHPSQESFENYLEAKAADGQLLTGFDRLHALRLNFDSDAPQRIRYAFDRRPGAAPIDYYRAREQRGWEHVGSSGDIHLWRREYTGERPEGFIGGELVPQAPALTRG
ncbi:MAG: DUF2812 domain-containing protein [Gordonia sp. (in: high G+C Gram-positive bacteria)]|uniref:DUF2812 domain-containing protein n=1 Tax=Gordonia sp. (in: high G+C Gram-positive bacteria) TaxID=84139 RepID=UPI0039E42A0A